MKMQVTCPCGCGHTFEVEVPKGTKNFSEEERAKRSERMKLIGGRKTGSKDTKPRKTRADKGMPRGEYQRLIDLQVNPTDSRYAQYMTMCHNGEQDPNKCPLANCNGGPCDMVVMDEGGWAKACESMLACNFRYRKYEKFRDK